MRGMVIVSIVMLGFIVPVNAAIVASGDLDPTFPSTDPWHVGGDLTVGWDDVGTLSVTDGSWLTSENGFLGYDYTGDGLVTVSGANSQWDNTGELWIAVSGLGELRLDQGALVTTDDLLVAGDEEGWGEGQIAVTGTDTWLDVADELWVGYTGVGVLLVEQGGTVTSAWAAIGAYPGSSGIVQVIDSGSQWIHSGPLYVGGDDYGVGGAGVLNVSDGGVVTATDLIVWSAGQLEGNGWVQADNVTVHGTLSPSGTLTVSGPLTLEANHNTVVDLTPQGGSDLIDVTGAITVHGGTVVARSAQTLTSQRTYTFLEGASLSGSFAGVDRRQVSIDLSDPGIPDLQVRTTATMARLQVVTLPFDDPVLIQTSHQQAVGTALQGMSDRGNRSLPEAVENLNGLDAVRSAYDQLSGVSRVTLPAIGLEIVDGFQRGLSGRLQENSPAPSHPRVAVTPVWGRSPRSVSLEQGRGLWGRAYGLTGRRFNESEVPGYRWNGAGANAGLDHWVTDLWLLGVAGGGAFTRVEYDSGNDRTDVESLHGGLYSRLLLGEVTLDAWGSLSDLNYQTRREVALTHERLQADFGGQTWSAALEGAWHWREVYDWRLEPLAGMQVTQGELDAAQETGGAAALHYAAQRWQSTRGWLGLRASGQIPLADARRIYSDLGLRWLHEFADDPPPVAAGFVQDSLATFTIQDSHVGRDRLLLGLGVRIELGQQTQIGCHYHGLFHPDVSSHLFSGGVLYRW